MIFLNEHPVITRQLEGHRHGIADASLGSFSSPYESLSIAFKIAIQVVLSRELIVVTEMRYPLVRAQLLPIPIQCLSQHISCFAPPQMPTSIFGVDYLKEGRCNTPIIFTNLTLSSLSILNFENNKDQK